MRGSAPSGSASALILGAWVLLTGAACAAASELGGGSSKLLSNTDRIFTRESWCCGHEKDETETAMIDVIKRRRSVRKYTAEPVSEAEVRELLEAAMAAPSASNLQPWHFVVVRDSERKGLLARTHRWSGMIADAAVAIAVCGEQTRSRHWVQDTSAATENLLLAATALGLGAVWIGIHPDRDREAKVREVLDIPEQIGVLCLIALGRPGEHKPPQHNYTEARIHHDRW